jgi:hypothetical protein
MEARRADDHLRCHNALDWLTLLARHPRGARCGVRQPCCRGSRAHDSARGTPLILPGTAMLCALVTIMSPICNSKELGAQALIRPGSVRLRRAHHMQQPAMLASSGVSQARTGARQREPSGTKDFYPQRMRVTTHRWKLHRHDTFAIHPTSATPAHHSRRSVGAPVPNYHSSAVRYTGQGQSKFHSAGSGEKIAVHTCTSPTADTMPTVIYHDMTNI